MKNYKMHILSFLMSMLVIGCSSGQATYVEAGGDKAVLTTNKINVGDWNRAATSMINELLSSKAIESINEPKPLKLMVSRVLNRTSDNIDTDMLTRKITTALANSGKVRVMSTDVASLELAKKQATAQGKTISEAKITLSGKIIETRDSNNDVNEVVYTFFLELNYNGEQVWAGEKQIAKQSNKSTFGF